MILIARFITRSFFLLSLLLPLSASLVSAQSSDWINIGPYGAIITSIVVEPSQANTIYIGTPLAGVFKSTDDGNSWTSAGIKSFINASKSINSLVMDRLNPNVLYASTESGIFKSTNGGTSWNNIYPGSFGLTVSAISLDPSKKNRLYAGINNGHLLLSDNGGENWAAANKTGVNGIPILKLSLYRKR